MSHGLEALRACASMRQFRKDCLRSLGRGFLRKGRLFIFLLVVHLVLNSWMHMASSPSSNPVASARVTTKRSSLTKPKHQCLKDGRMVVKIRMVIRYEKEEKKGYGVSTSLFQRLKWYWGFQHCQPWWCQGTCRGVERLRRNHAKTGNPRCCH